MVKFNGNTRYFRANIAFNDLRCDRKFLFLITFNLRKLKQILNLRLFTFKNYREHPHFLSCIDFNRAACLD